MPSSPSRLPFRLCNLFVRFLSLLFPQFLIRISLPFTSSELNNNVLMAGERLPSTRLWTWRGGTRVKQKLRIRGEKIFRPVIIEIIALWHPVLC